MRRKDGSIPPKRTYAEIMEDLNTASDDYKKSTLHKRLLIRAELDRKDEENNQHLKTLPIHD